LVNNKIKTRNTNDQKMRWARVSKAETLDNNFQNIGSIPYAKKA